MIHLVDLLKEGVTVSDKGTLEINIIRSTDKETDPFLINRGRDYTKIYGVPTFYGISPNPQAEVEDVTDIYDTTKDVNTLQEDDLKKLVLLTAPPEAVQYIIGLTSSSGLNAKLVEALKQKYKVPDSKVITSISKIEYMIDDMIDQEKYDKSDPVTQSIAKGWTDRLKKRYGTDTKMVIKKSRNKITKHPGIQSGGRSLLKPAYKIDGELSKMAKILVVDDFIISGSSLKEVYEILLQKGVPKENIVGYCMGIKGSKKEASKQKINEMHTLDHDGYDEFHQVRADHEESIQEMSLTSVGIPEFIEYVKQNPDTIEYFGFPSYKALLDYVLESNPREWYELRKELEDYKRNIGAGAQELHEIDSFCPQCLAEYLMEYGQALEEAEYQGRKVTLGKPFLTPGGPKKRSVYVKNNKGNVVKVNFGDPNMTIKKSDPERRKSFRARHNCDTAKDRTSPRYWSCKAW